MGAIEVKKILLRNNVVRCTSSSYYSLQGEKNYKSLKELLIDYNMNYILKKVYDETTKDYEQLCTSYTNAIKTANNDFMLCYKISKEFAVKIDSHITLYKLEKPIFVGKDKLIPWRYASGECYIGDSWWFSDEEIIEDLTKMTLLEFILKYKGLF